LRGKLICFEGIDGAGKTTISHVVADLLSANRATTHIAKKTVPAAGNYAAEHLRALQRIIWEYPPDSPLLDLGDHHWLHLMASWFAALDFCAVRPALTQSDFVVVDNWFYKFAARFMLKPAFERVDVFAAFARLSQPDLVVFLDIEPALAATRRGWISRSEAGRLESDREANREQFARYQERVRSELCLFAERDPAWTRIPISETASPAAIAEVVLHTLCIDPPAVR